MKNQLSRTPAAVFAFVAAILAWSLAHAQTTPTKPLTIDAIYQPGGLGGHPPETVQWSPDGTKLSFVLRDDNEEMGDLWAIDTATGEKKVDRKSVV